MASEIRKGWTFAVAGLAMLAAVLGWAWHDGGKRELAPMSAPAMLPKVGP